MGRGHGRRSWPRTGGGSGCSPAPPALFFGCALGRALVPFLEPAPAGVSGTRDGEGAWRPASPARRAPGRSLGRCSREPSSSPRPLLLLPLPSPPPSRTRCHRQTRTEPLTFSRRAHRSETRSPPPVRTLECQCSVPEEAVASGSPAGPPLRWWPGPARLTLGLRRASARDPGEGRPAPRRRTPRVELRRLLRVLSPRPRLPPRRLRGSPSRSAAVPLGCSRLRLGDWGPSPDWPGAQPPTFVLPGVMWC
ncbi:uncharacterized protein [Oryctolagus cuniculus]|uniref:uncharacterized protein n=1 Tax=Oryctolagus cuniculus TaxID=9986 RepID=UPI003879783C